VRSRVCSGTGWVLLLAWTIALALFPLYKGLWLGYVPVLAGIVIGLALTRSRAPLTRRLMSVPRTPFVAGAMLLALSLRAAAALYFPLAPANDHEMFYRLAASVASGDGYRLESGPTAFFPPGLPLMLAAWFAVTGIGLWQAKLLGLALGMATVWVTWRYAVAVLDEGAARWALLIVTIVPTLVFYSVTVGYEQLLAIILVGWSALVERASGRTVVTRTTIGIGLLTGLGAMVKPVCLLLPAVCALRWWPEGRRVAVARAGVGVIAMVVVIAPWTARNLAVLGSPVPVSTNGGFVLYSANNATSTGLASPVASLPGEHDEVSRDRIRRAAALRWIAEHPIDWARLAVTKVVYGWGTTSSIMSFVSFDRMPARQEDACKALLNVGWGVLFILCLAATLRTRVWATERLTSAILLIAYLFVLHLFFEALSRHHIPLIPFLAMIAGAGLSLAANRTRTAAAEPMRIAGSV
jgi:4-amino-4-deoxy-L-arabinose transferase-like glycosyltransferase